jgi:hypothetical protein
MVTVSVLAQAPVAGINTQAARTTASGSQDSGRGLRRKIPERDFTAEMLGERRWAVCAKGRVTTAGNKRTTALFVKKGMGSVSIEKKAISRGAT